MCLFERAPERTNADMASPLKTHEANVVSPPRLTVCLIVVEVQVLPRSLYSYQFTSYFVRVAGGSLD
jgi:hypothetical protein